MMHVLSIGEANMNHYFAAVLLMIVAIGFPMLCAALGMKVNTRDPWW